MPAELEDEIARAAYVNVIHLPASLRTQDVKLRDLVSHRAAVQITDTVESVFTRFTKTEVEFMGVLDRHKLVGICSRHRISDLLGGRYGFSLWARKPIGTHLSPQETRVSIATPIQDVLQKVFARGDDAFYDDVLLVDENESFLGLISTQTLFKVQNSLLRTNISDLVEKEQEIQRKNEQMETDLRMAMELQQALMSVNYPEFSTQGARLTFSHRYRPASIVGGDFFFIARISDFSAGLFICDVMGHGVRSALITSMLRALIEALGPRAADPAYLLTELNTELISILRHTDTILFVTALYCTIDSATGRLCFADAGHPRPLHFDATRSEIRSHEFGGEKNDPALGLLPNAHYQNKTIDLGPNDHVLLFTDGIIEAEGPSGELFGVERLIGSLGRYAGSENLLEDIENDVRSFVGSSLFEDDVCLVSVQWKID